MGGLVMATEFFRCTVIEARMRPYVIVMTPPDFDEDACFGATAKPLHAQAFVAELAVEALIGAVLPRVSGIDQRSVDLRLGELLKDHLAHEFRAILRAQDRNHLPFGKPDLRHQLLASSAGAIVSSDEWSEKPGQVNALGSLPPARYREHLLQAEIPA